MRRATRPLSDGTAFDVTDAGGEVTDGGRQVVDLGDAVTIRVTSDVTDRIHLHGGFAGRTNGGKVVHLGVVVIAVAMAGRSPTAGRANVDSIRAPPQPWAGTRWSTRA